MFEKEDMLIILVILVLYVIYVLYDSKKLTTAASPDTSATYVPYDMYNAYYDNPFAYGYGHYGYPYGRGYGRGHRRGWRW